jgi:peroxiredoxin
LHERIIPGEAMPAMSARLLDGKSADAEWTIDGERPERLALLAFYRGVFCPICATWVADLDKLVPQFEQRGVSVIALSCDAKDGAEKAVKDWGLNKLRVGYDLGLEGARKAGLYVSEGRGVNSASGLKESRLFVEPALLLVKPEGDLYATWIQSSPYARVHVAEILTATDNYLSKNIPPARGSA